MRFSERCEKCSRELKVGDWPFCNGSPSDHGSVRSRGAENGPATIVYKNQKGECWFPTGVRAVPPKGYEKHELKTQRDRDKFEHEINAKETAKLRERVYSDREAWHRTIEENKKSLEDVQTSMKKAGYEPQLIEECLKNYERREKNYDSQLRSEAGFYIESNHFRSGYRHDE